MNFKYPDPLKPGDVIGVTAPSSGIGEFANRYQYVKQCLLERGFRIMEGRCLFSDVRHVSGSAAERAADFMRLWLDPEVSAIIPPWGGELLIQILEHLDWKVLADSKPKWVMGYSDISLLLATITWHTGVITAHGTNLMEMANSETEPLTRNALDALMLSNGSMLTQLSAKKFATTWSNYKTIIDATYSYTEPVEWKSLSGNSEQITGRPIGGCVDVLAPIVGTRYDRMREFKEACGSERAIIYLENCDFSPNQFCRALYQFKYAGWFDGIAGVVLGRNRCGSQPDDPQSYEVVLREFFSGFSFPVIYDVDIGHRQPNSTVLNGAFTVIRREGNRLGSIDIRKV